MSDRTPEQVAADAFFDSPAEAMERRLVGSVGNRDKCDGQARKALNALRRAGFAIVRLDGLEERMAHVLEAAVTGYRFDDDGSPLPMLYPTEAAEIAARVVRGETQEADRG